ncbi:dynein light chain Tctex-type protein 2B isoform X2 [Drosophila grimshawi]|uniref:dynein light chain Tctex-type protein 2B isoform X2 n=1 Tax=Drosophila grimshawi TaxID=7222 RepID=UPI000C86FBBE|nr:dynein light chain Tctex-type protein 2B isoform X2 [Drosophila grimshawi]
MQRQISSQRDSLTKCASVVAALGATPKVSDDEAHLIPDLLSSLLLFVVRQENIRYMPTYRLDPKNPLIKERLEIAMRTIMDKNYNEDYLFHPKQSYHLAAQVSEEIKDSIKLMDFDRYRYVVLVSVGELLMQGLCSMVNFLWDADKDGFVTYSIQTPNYFAVCTIFYLYYD